MRRLYQLVSLLLTLCLPAQAVTVSALNYYCSEESNSDVRLVWSGSNLLSRTEHTTIIRANPRQQNGYYAWQWHSQNNGPDTWDYGAYNFGTHPYPASDCQVDGSGAQINGTGGGPDHCWEEAGIADACTVGGNPGDCLATAGVNPGYVVVKERWYVQIRRVHLATSGPCNGTYEHTYIPDFLNNPSNVITQCDASIDASDGSSAYYIGASDWRSGYGGTSFNDEGACARIRGIQLYSTALSSTDYAAEAANQYSNTPVTSAGLSNVWYMNQNPTVADVTDKSGAGHNPSWANAYRPADWDSTYTISSGSAFRTLLGVGK